jgi:hypothetical protein
MIKPPLVVSGVFAGVFGTLCMDLGGSFFRKKGLIAGVPPAYFGKWVAYAAKGKLFHADIAAAPAVAVSVPMIFLTHYAIGAILGAVFAVLWQMIPSGLALRFPIAVFYGFCTSVFAWFLMFPAMGFGAFGSKGPDQFLLFRSSLVNHLVYGASLWIPMAVVTAIGLLE